MKLAAFVACRRLRYSRVLQRMGQQSAELFLYRKTLLSCLVQWIRRINRAFFAFTYGNRLGLCHCLLVDHFTIIAYVFHHQIRLPGITSTHRRIFVLKFQNATGERYTGEDGGVENGSVESNRSQPVSLAMGKDSPWSAAKDSVRAYDVFHICWIWSALCAERDVRHC